MLDRVQQTTVQNVGTEHQVGEMQTERKQEELSVSLAAPLSHLSGPVALRPRLTTGMPFASSNDLTRIQQQQVSVLTIISSILDYI
jgi:hypothetical protein